MFDAHGAAIGPDVLISPAGGSGASSSDSSVTALADGHAVVVWAKHSGSGDSIYARVINPDGTMSQPEFIVNQETGLGESAPHVSQLPNGEVFVTWTTSAGLNEDIHGRLLTIDGAVSGTGGKDALFGDAGGDHFDFRPGNGVLSGGDSSHLVAGNNGNDAAGDGAGADTSASSAGADSFLFKGLHESMPVQQNQSADFSSVNGDHSLAPRFDASMQATVDQQVVRTIGPHYVQSSQVAPKPLPRSHPLWIG